MATTPVTVYHDLEGMTSPVLLLYPVDGGAAANGAGDSLTQSNNGEYAWNAIVSEALDGVYRYEVVSDGIAVAWGFVRLQDTTDRCHGDPTVSGASSGGRIQQISEQLQEISDLVQETAQIRFHVNYDPQGNVGQFCVWLEFNGKPVDLSDDEVVSCDLHVQEFGGEIPLFEITGAGVGDVIEGKFMLAQTAPNLVDGKSYHISAVLTYQEKVYQGTTQFSFWGGADE